MELATLTGSEKQIAWAERLRAERMAKIEEVISRLAARAQTDERIAKIASWRAVAADLAAVADAADWIDGQGLADGVLYQAHGGPTYERRDAAKELDRM